MPGFTEAWNDVCSLPEVAARRPRVARRGLPAPRRLCGAVGAGDRAGHHADLPVPVAVGREIGFRAHICHGPVLAGPGKMIQTFFGGENLKFFDPQETLSIAPMHPLVQAILCIWAVGR